MGATATRLAHDVRIPQEPFLVSPVAAAAPARPVRRSGSPAVLQAKWQDIDRIDPSSLLRPDLENALGELAQAVRSPLLLQYQGLAEFFKIGGSGVLGPVREYLKTTSRDEKLYATNDLLAEVVGRVTTGMRPQMQAIRGGSDDENDHPEEDSPSVEEELITDPTHIDTRELLGEPGLLEIIFRNIAAAQGYPNVTVDAFKEWYQSGVVTRRRFREILERHSPPDVSSREGDMLMQLKRSPNTASGPSTYVSSNYGQFTNVIYTTNSKANIDFSAPTSRGTSWTNPVMPGTVVKLSKGATRKGYGILNNGVETKLFRAGRTRHNMIANRLRPDLVNAAKVSYTWHHRTQEYEMELVDYMVHLKHGHNGGYLFWRDGQ
jgi:hypothetical protein